MENPNVETINKINHLISIAEDGKQGYENAAKDVEAPEMKALFSRFSSERAEFVTQLRSHVKSLGGDPEHDGGPLGAAHRLWIDLKSALTSGDKTAIINACVTGEEAAISAYEGALKEDYITGELRNVINSQLGSIQQALGAIQAHKSASNA
jgi:uncharacterized protein (TIGR02284 family)